MEFKVKGKLEAIGQVEKGVAKSSGKEWEKLTFVVNTGEEYNPLMAFGIFGEEKVNRFKGDAKVGDNIEVDFNIKCNEWQGKFFTSLDAWKWTIEFKGESQGNGNPSGGKESSDDLPF